MECYIIDGRKMIEKKQTHDYLQRVLLLPEYYGKNLDALNDCLSELPKDSTITIINTESLLANLGKYGQTILEIFQKNAQEIGFQFKCE